jgi:hypothetical protein
MIQVSRQSWHARVYLAWFEKKHHYLQEDVIVNLCPYMRAILLRAPVRFLFGDWITVSIRGKKIPLGFITVPVTYISTALLAGYISYDIKLFLFAIVYFLVFSAVLSGIGWLVAYAWDNSKSLEKNVSDFRALVKQWVKSKYDRLCPSVEIK